jgi:YgiT-type zinc finger domain-containing protein
MTLSQEASPGSTSTLCPICHVGHLREKRSTYTERYDGQLIVVPNVPVQVCDYCGETHYHPVVLERLHQLLLADTGQQRAGNPSKTRQPSGSPHSKTPTVSSDP